MLAKLHFSFENTRAYTKINKVRKTDAAWQKP